MRTQLNRKGRVSLPIALTATLVLALAFIFNACSGDDGADSQDPSSSSKGYKWCSGTNPDDGMVMCAEIGKSAVLSIEDDIAGGGTYTEEICRNANATLSEAKPQNCRFIITGDSQICNGYNWLAVNFDQSKPDLFVCYEVGKVIMIPKPDFLTAGTTFSKEICGTMYHLFSQYYNANLAKEKQQNCVGANTVE
jgi:hypothetical protein